MKDIIIVAVLLAIIAVAAGYVVKAKKSGKKCIGCPDGCCSSNKGKSSGCSCGCGGSKE